MTVPRVDRRTSGQLPPTADIVIIGAGIVGVATALFLAQRGLHPIVVDSAPDIGCRTTAMSAHCIRAQFSEPENIRMMAESLDFYEHLAERCGLDTATGAIDLCQQGYLFASTSESDSVVFADRMARQEAAGLDDIELLSWEAVRRRFPWLSEEIVVATFRPRDGWIDSALAIEAMAAASQVPIFLDTKVLRISTRAGRGTGVQTSAGDVASETVILAAGPFSRSLAPEPLPISLLRRHRVIVAPHPAIPQSGPVTIDANTGAHWRPHRGGALVAWAQPETDGDATWPVPPDPGFVDLALRSDAGIGRLAPFWKDLAPTLAASDLLLTAGQYTVTPDHRPLIGPARSTVGLFLHTGYSGHGIMGAPAGARLLADLLSSNAEMANPFSPSRFTGSMPPSDTEQVVI